MPDFPSRAELFQTGADAILLRSEARPPGRRITAQEVYTEGSDANLLLNGAASMAHEVLYQSQVRLAALLLDGADGEDLDRLVADRFSPTIVRKQASPAVVTLALSRVLGPLSGGTIAIGTGFKTETGLEFTLTTSASFPASSTGPVFAVAQCTTTGTAGNVAPGTITIPSISLFDPNITAMNPDVASGGDDVETDARLRTRAKKFFLAARRGTMRAIEFGALTVSGIRSATAIEGLDAFGFPNGDVSCYVADANGNANAILTSAVLTALYEYRSGGVRVDVVGATPFFQPIVLRLRYQAGIDTAIAFDRVRLAVVSAVNTLAPQQTLERSLIYEACRRIPGVIVLDDAVVVPAGDVVPTSGQILRTNLESITAAI